MVSEVFEYVPTDRIYSVTVFWLSFDTFADRNAIWRNFDKDRRMNFKILIMFTYLFFYYRKQARYILN
jgi:hypothetical protein